MLRDGLVPWFFSFYVFACVLLGTREIGLYLGLPEVVIVPTAIAAMVYSMYVLDIGIMEAMRRSSAWWRKAR